IAAIQAGVPEALLPGWVGPGARPGGLQPLEIAALGERLQAVVTNDCGTAHMLAAGQAPMLSLFGATNPVKYRPATPIHRVLQRSSAGAEAIEAISVDEVSDALDLLIASLAPAPAFERAASTADTALALAKS